MESGRKILSILLTGLAICLYSGCNGEPGDDDDTTEEEENGIEIDIPVTGDFSCLGNNPDPDPTGASINITGSIIDFEEDEPVSDALIDFYYGNMITGSPDDTSGPTGEDGSIHAEGAPALTYIAYHVYQETSPPDIKDTYEFNVLTPDLAEGETWTGEEFTSVSGQTFSLITSILGISPDPDRAVVAGTFKDCNGDPVKGGVADIVDEEGESADGIKVRYFTEEFPDRYQPYTSEDGLFGIVDVPEGHWTVQLWGILEEGGDPEVLAYNEIDAFADSVCITNVWPR